MDIQGKNTRLRPARIEDRRKIFEWLTQSDVTPSIMGSPEYPDHPVPSWEEFKNDYTSSFFQDNTNATGKNYIILVGETEVGTIGYDNLDFHKGMVDLDIWMRAEAFCGHGYGSEAINTLTDHLHHTHGVYEFRVDPSSRNTRAIKAYRRSGFIEERRVNPDESADYYDTIVMVKRIAHRTMPSSRRREHRG